MAGTSPAMTLTHCLSIVMPGFMPGIHGFAVERLQARMERLHRLGLICQRLLFQDLLQELSPFLLGNQPEQLVSQHVVRGRDQQVAIAPQLVPFGRIHDRAPGTPVCAWS